MLNASIEVRGSDIEGRGLFAREKIKQGEFVWSKEPDEKYYTRAQIDAFTPEQKKNFYNYCYQVGPEQFYGTPQGAALDDADYMNHSCDPNTWFEKDGSMTALRDILPGEEITYDYATSESRADFILHCRCGTTLCRGTVRGNDYAKLGTLKARYGMHVMPHVIPAT
jgi:SET domain-containing protein